MTITTPPSKPSFGVGSYGVNALADKRAGDKEKPSLFTPLSPEKAAEAKRVNDVLSQTLAAMKNSKNDIAQQKKAMAQQKIARIKEALKSLKQMTFADPKGSARMAARLARELAAAIKEYGAAGATYTEVQSASGGAQASATTQDSQQQGTQSTEQSTEQAADAAIAASTGVLAEITTSAPPVPETTPVATAASTAYAKADQTTQSTDKDAKDGNTKAIETGSSTTGETKRTRKKDDDSPFMKDAKETLDELRAFIQSLRARMGKKPLFRADEAELAQKALKEAERAYASLTISAQSG